MYTWSLMGVCHHFSLTSLCRSHSMYVNGSKITRQFQQGNKRLSMHMSKQTCFQQISWFFWLMKAFMLQHYMLVLILMIAFKWCVIKFLWPVSVNHVYRFVKKKFEELYFQSSAPDRVDRVFKIYRTTALDQKVVKKTFKLVDETLRRRNLFEAGLLWPCNTMLVNFRRIQSFLHWRGHQIFGVY